MSEPEVGPSGETTKTEPRVDPATGRPLPAEINGIRLTENFDSSRDSTWPKKLTRKDVDAWLFSKADKEDPLAADISPGTQPARDEPVDEDGNPFDVKKLGWAVKKLQGQVAQLQREIKPLQEKFSAPVTRSTR